MYTEKNVEKPEVTRMSGKFSLLPDAKYEWEVDECAPTNLESNDPIERETDKGATYLLVRDLELWEFEATNDVSK